MTSTLHLVGNVAVWVALLSALAFCATYWVIARWWHSAEGQHLMAFTGVIGVAFGWIAYRQTWHGPPAMALSLELPRALILGALAGCLVWRLLLLLRAQIRRRKRR